MQFTVLLLVPDTLAGNFGHDNYAYHATVDASIMGAAVAVRVAVAEARDYAMDAYEAWNDGIEPTAFHVLAVYPGHLDDLNPEA